MVNIALFITCFKINVMTVTPMQKKKPHIYLAFLVKKILFFDLADGTDKGQVISV